MSTFNKANILIPNKDIDLQKWSVIACDQYTSEPEYWERVKKYVGEAPSALNLVFPEVYLSEGTQRIEKINAAMDEYTENGVFEECLDSMIYVERTQSDGRIRRGIVGAVDLEDYDFGAGAKSKIRATEGTVLERIPPRVKIRENAALELPHIMILINDENNTVIRPSEGETLYDFELMENGGHLKGTLMTDSEAEHVLAALSSLENNAYDGLCYAVGDGNHSLATAKTCWENIKAGLDDGQIKNHPARFCLVELVNIHDTALDFEPIHRVVFNSDESLIKGMKDFYPETSETDNGGQKINYICGGKEGCVYVKNSGCTLTVGTLQKYLDSKKLKIDYIHGEDVVKRLAADKNIGFILPPMDKSELFLSVAKDGALPRKTFSMGEAADKRFYLEAKRIK